MCDAQRIDPTIAEAAGQGKQGRANGHDDQAGPQQSIIVRHWPWATRTRDSENNLQIFCFVVETRRLSLWPPTDDHVTKLIGWVFFY